MSSKQNFSYQCNENVETFVEDILKDCHDPRSIQLFVDDILNDMEGIEKRRQNLFRSFQACNLYNTNNCVSRNNPNALHCSKSAPQNGNSQHLQNIEYTPTYLKALQKPTLPPKPQTLSIPSNSENSTSDNSSKNSQLSQPMLVEVREPIQQDNNLQILVNIKYPNSKSTPANKPSTENLSKSLKAIESQNATNLLQNSQKSYPFLSKTQERLPEKVRPYMTSYNELQMYQQENLQPSEEGKSANYKNSQNPENTNYSIHRNQQPDTFPQGLNNLRFSIKLPQPEVSQISENPKYINYMSNLNDIPFQNLKQSEFPTEFEEPEESQIPENTLYKNLKKKQTDNSPQDLRETEIHPALCQIKDVQTPKNLKCINVKSKPSENASKNLEQPESYTDLQKTNALQTPGNIRNNGLQRAKSPQALMNTEFSTESPEPISLQIPKSTKAINFNNLSKDLKQSESASDLYEANEPQMLKNIKCMKYRGYKAKNLLEDVSPTSTPMQEPEDESIIQPTHCTGCDCMKPLFLLLQNQRDGSLHLESIKNLCSQPNSQTTQEEDSSLFKTQNLMSELRLPRVPPRRKLEIPQPEFLQLSDDTKYRMHRDIQIPEIQNTDDVTQGNRWPDGYMDLSFTLSSNNDTEY